MSFSKLNNLTGWIIFAIASAVYLLTVEDTASFWDCGEFIAVSYKLEVPHPPGAPFFLLIGRLFSMFAFGDVLRVAYWVNLVSVFSSSFTILFLYWTIVLLAKKFFEGEKFEDLSFSSQLTCIGSGVVGALAYTFSDSFWFSAVEAEVYGMSSFFTALVVWLMLKWDNIEDEAAANRMLLLITYMMGLSIGVHLLNLLTVPALCFIYYFKKYKPTQNGFVLTLMAAGFILIFVNALIPVLPSVAGNFEIFFVNTLSLPFGTGAAIFVIGLVGGLVYAIRYSIKKQNVNLNTALLALSFILIGYSSYALILIRSNQNPPIDENNPEDVMTFVSYLKREQYGDRPLLYGQSFTSERTGSDRGAAQYRKGEKKYEIYDYKVIPTYEGNKMLFPRIYSTSDNHVSLYREKLGLRENQNPTFADNIRFFFKHQLGHMYWRYFMWNFAGRDHDEKEADWLSPFAPTDLPEEIAKNKAHDNFYMLPFLLGVLGLFFQYKKDPKGAWITFLLFAMMGVVLVVYLNSPPVEPRERDYVYVGSFYAFSIWIGLSVAFLSDFFSKFLKGASAYAAIPLALCVPVMMGAKGWDNHNRTGRYLSVDQARNTLASCAPNAILFTGGDNDTFPLWYVQEVEGFRTDVRVVVLSYFSTDWYIDQMKKQVYESQPLPISLEQRNYLQGKNDFLPVRDAKEGRKVNLKTFMNLLKKDDPKVLVPLQDGTTTGYIPSKTLSLDIDSAYVSGLGIVPKGKENQVPKSMDINIRGSYIMKSDLMILDILATSEWKRPIYFNNTSANTCNIDILPYLQMEGMALRLLPVRAVNPGETGEVDVETTLARLKEFQYRGLQDENAYYDDEYRKFAAGYQNIHFRTAYELIRTGRKPEAGQLLDDILAKIPDNVIPYSYYTPRFCELYFLLDQDEKAKKITDLMTERAKESLTYLINNKLNNFCNSEISNRNLLVLNEFMKIFKRADNRATEEVKRLEMILEAEKEGKIEPAGDTAERLTKMKARQEYYSSEYKRIEKLFTELYDQI